ncbi:hypothetical protein NCC49_000685 [Naganishia albida]|nr:hypothetical protein NCC49_000685 [Naganishia albida]
MTRRKKASGEESSAGKGKGKRRESSRSAGRGSPECMSSKHESAAGRSRGVEKGMRFFPDHQIQQPEIGGGSSRRKKEKKRSTRAEEAAGSSLLKDEILALEPTPAYQLPRQFYKVRRIFTPEGSATPEPPSSSIRSIDEPPFINVDVLREVGKHLVRQLALKTLANLAAAGTLTRYNLQVESYEVKIVKFAGEPKAHRGWEAFRQSGNDRHVRVLVVDNPEEAINIYTSLLADYCETSLVCLSSTPTGPILHLCSDRTDILKPDLLPLIVNRLGKIVPEWFVNNPSLQVELHALPVRPLPSTPEEDLVRPAAPSPAESPSLEPFLCIRGISIRPASSEVKCPNALVCAVGQSLSLSWKDRDETDIVLAESGRPSMAVEGFGFWEEFEWWTELLSEIYTIRRQCSKFDLTVCLRSHDRNRPPTISTSDLMFQQFRLSYLHTLRAVLEESDYVGQGVRTPTLRINVVGSRWDVFSVQFQYNSERNGVDVHWYNREDVVRQMMLGSRFWPL